MSSARSTAGSVLYYNGADPGGDSEGHSGLQGGELLGPPRGQLQPEVPLTVHEWLPIAVQAVSDRALRPGCHIQDQALSAEVWNG